MAMGVRGVLANKGNWDCYLLFVNVKGLILGFILRNSVPVLFMLLVEATAFGSKSIVCCF